MRRGGAGGATPLGQRLKTVLGVPGWMARDVYVGRVGSIPRAAII